MPGTVEGGESGPPPPRLIIFYVSWWAWPTIARTKPRNKLSYCPDVCFIGLFLAGQLDPLGPVPFFLPPVPPWTFAIRATDPRNSSPRGPPLPPGKPLASRNLRPPWRPSLAEACVDNICNGPKRPPMDPAVCCESSKSPRPEEKSRKGESPHHTENPFLPFAIFGKVSKEKQKFGHCFGAP